MLPSSAIDWAQKISTIEVDLNHVWETNYLLHDASVGESHEERMVDFLFERRPNDPTPLNLVPISGTNVSNQELREFMRSRHHMFVTRLWQLIQESYASNKNSVKAVTATSISERVRDEIQQALREHPASQKIYLRTFDEWALPNVIDSLSDAIAHAIAESLSDQERTIVLKEREVHFGPLPEEVGQEGQFTEDDYVEEYICPFVDEFLGERKARAMLQQSWQSQ